MQRAEYVSQICMHSICSVIFSIRHNDTWITVIMIFNCCWAYLDCAIMGKRDLWSNMKRVTCYDYCWIYMKGVMRVKIYF